MKDTVLESPKAAILPITFTSRCFLWYNSKMKISTPIGIVAVCAALFCAPSAHAYIDPGSGSALITAILGVIGAIGYTFRKYYYKIKKLFGGRADKQKRK